MPTYVMIVRNIRCNVLCIGMEQVISCDRMVLDKTDYFQIKVKKK